MITAEAKFATEGVAIGTLHIYSRPAPSTAKRELLDIDNEILKFGAAIDLTKKDITELREIAIEAEREDLAANLYSYIQILDDSGYRDDIQEIIIHGSNVEYAITEIVGNYSMMMAEMNDPDMTKRCIDIMEVSDQLLHIIDDSFDTYESKESYILAAEKLTPSEIDHIDTSKLLGIIVKDPNYEPYINSLSYKLNIPALVDISIDLVEEYEGKTSIVDGFDSELLIDPSPEVLENMKSFSSKYL